MYVQAVTGIYMYNIIYIIICREEILLDDQLTFLTASLVFLPDMVLSEQRETTFNTTFIQTLLCTYLSLHPPSLSHVNSAGTPMMTNCPTLSSCRGRMLGCHGYGMST